jgi:hypothetical protein
MVDRGCTLHVFIPPKLCMNCVCVLATPPYTAVLARPAELLALVSSAVVLADARALLHCLH